MPGAALERHELHQFAVAAYQQVRGYAQTLNRGEIGMGVRRQGSQEQMFNPGSAELARWQADAVDHQQINLGTCGALVAMGRGQLPGAADETGDPVPPRLYGRGAIRRIFHGVMLPGMKQMRKMPRAACLPV